MNVMIVDDEVLTRTNVKYILEAEIPAYTGTTSYMLCGEAGSGAEALEKLPGLQTGYCVVGYEDAGNERP